MSFTLSFSGNTSQLSVEHFPPIYLDEKYEWVVGLLSFESFHSIPNIDRHNCAIDIGNFRYKIPEGTYEISDLNNAINKLLKERAVAVAAAESTKKTPPPPYFSLTVNANTLRTELICSEIVTFNNHYRSIGKLLGFEDHVKLAKSPTVNVSTSLVNIFDISTLSVESNIVGGSYSNGKTAHILHQFFPHVPPGYKIVEQPSTVVYLPLITRIIDNVCINIVDQSGNPVNFRGETITVRIHIKRL